MPRLRAVVLAAGPMLPLAIAAGVLLLLFPVPLGRFGHVPMTALAPFLTLVALGRGPALAVAAGCLLAAFAIEETPLRPLLAAAEMLAVIGLSPGRGRTPVVSDAVFWLVAGAVALAGGLVVPGDATATGTVVPHDPTPLLLPLAGLTAAALATLMAIPLGGLLRRRGPDTGRAPMVSLVGVLLAVLVLFAAAPGLIVAQATTDGIDRSVEHDATRLAELGTERASSAFALLMEGEAEPVGGADLVRRLGNLIVLRQGRLDLITATGELLGTYPATPQVADGCGIGLGETVGDGRTFWVRQRPSRWSWSAEAFPCVIRELRDVDAAGSRLRVTIAAELRRDIELGKLGDLARTALITTFMALGVAAVLARALSRPLLQLGATVARIPDGGLGHRDVPGGGVVEVVELGRRLVALNRDLIEQRQRAGRLEVHLRRIVEHAPIGIYLLHWEPDGRLRMDYCSPSVGHQLGLWQADLDGAASWLERVHPADRDEVAQARGALDVRRSFVIQYRLRDGGGSYRWVHDELKLLEPEADGSRDGVGILLDVHDRRETELRLLQMSKLVTLGEMATGMAHELNQPLNVIRMAIDNLRIRLGVDETDDGYVAQKLRRIDEQTRRAARLVDQMRVFGRQSRAEPQPFAVDQVLGRVLALTEEQLRPIGIEIELTVAAELPQLRGAGELLDQAVLNLILNARDAIVEDRSRPGAGRNGRIEVAAWRSPDAVTITVTDDGGGIGEDALDRLFQPFFTTKPPGKGTGLGLSIAFGIVRDMGGSITAENEAAGARFTIALPCLA